MVDVWKRNAKIEPYEGITSLWYIYIYHTYINMISINYAPVYLPYAAFHSEVRCIWYKVVW